MSTIKVNAVESTSSGGIAAKIASINDGALKDFIEAEVTNKDLATKIVAEATT